MGLLPRPNQASGGCWKHLYEAYREALAHRRRHEIERGMTWSAHTVTNALHLQRARYGHLRLLARAATNHGLALHLAELRWLEQTTGESPVLLLDEVLAEL